ncbi:metallophosphoesterase [Patescibacteria group bacterium]|nr:metallophosphoesterase [Patescibacteria group bacterium]MCL5092003.1 metallophosphoesterase [Patescibacteria group bacterium]
MGNTSVAVAEIGDGLSPLATSVARSETIQPPEVDKPIQENTFYVKNVRIIPDYHGGREIVKHSTPVNQPVQEPPFSEFTENMKEGEVIVSAGDVIDRGAHSLEAAKVMMQLVKEGKAVWNYGNHELLFMAAMQGNNEAFMTWFGNGGMAMLNQLGIVSADQARNHPQLQELYQFLINYGKTYTVVDNVLVTHAGFLADPATGSLLPVTINGVNYGSGIDAMDKIQAAIRQGDKRVIEWLANHGGNDVNNKDNPFWVRETNFQEVVRDPLKAHKLREQLNGQMTGKKSRGENAGEINLIVVGHTPYRPEMGKQAAATTMLDETTSKALPRFLYADEEYYRTGAARITKLEVNDGQPDEVHVTYLEVDKAVVGSDGKALLEHRYPMDRRVELAPPVKSEAERSKEAENALTRELAADFGIEMPEIAHQMLEVISHGGNFSEQLSKLGDQYISEAATINDPGRQSRRRALGLDLQIGAKQLEINSIAETVRSAQPNSQKTKELQGQCVNLQGQLDELIARRQPLKESNALTVLAQAFGVSDEEAQQAPMIGIGRQITQAVADGEVATDTLRHLEQSQLADKEDVKMIARFLKSERVKKVVQEKAARGVRVVGQLGSLLALFALLKALEKKPQGAG